jgi:nucleotide-binding universal stress UspA family protein
MIQRILVPLDGSDTEHRVMGQAIEMARAHRAKLVLLHVVTEYPMMVEMASVASIDVMRRSLRHYGEQVLAEATEFCSQHDVEVQSVLREVPNARAAEAIVDEVQRSSCDMIVLGTHGRTGLTRLVLGSDAQLILRSSPVPILVVRMAPAAP